MMKAPVVFEMGAEKEYVTRMPMTPRDMANEHKVSNDALVEKKNIRQYFDLNPATKVAGWSSLSHRD
jgi:hypothetical protein